MPLICDLLAQLHASEDLPIKRLASLLNVSPSSGSRYTKGTVIDAQQLRTLFQHCDSIDAQRDLLGYLAAGTGWVYSIHEGIGSTEVPDGHGELPAAAASAMEGLSCLLPQILAGAPTSARPDQAAAAVASLDRIIDRLIFLRRFASYCTDAQP